MSRFCLFRKSLASSIAFNAAGKRFLRWQGKVSLHYFIQISDSDDHLRKWKWAPILVIF